MKIPDKWRAVLNLVFAIGEKHRQLIEGRDQPRDHLVYMTRAIRLLDLDNVSILAMSPDVTVLQVSMLLRY
jgi:hypothetical protein